MPKGTENKFAISSHIIVVREYVRCQLYYPYLIPLSSCLNNVIVTYNLVRGLVCRDNIILGMGKDKCLSTCAFLTIDGAAMQIRHGIK